MPRQIYYWSATHDAELRKHAEAQVAVAKRDGHTMPSRPSWLCRRSVRDENGMWMYYTKSFDQLDPSVVLWMKACGNMTEWESYCKQYPDAVCVCEDGSFSDTRMDYYPGILENTPPAPPVQVPAERVQAVQELARYESPFPPPNSVRLRTVKSVKVPVDAAKVQKQILDMVNAVQEEKTKAALEAITGEPRVVPDPSPPEVEEFVEKEGRRRFLLEAQEDDG